MGGEGGEGEKMDISEEREKVHDYKEGMNQGKA